MRHLSLCSVLTVVLMTGASGCAALSGLGAKQETLAQQVLSPGLPAPALAALERLIAGGEIWTLKQGERGGETVYDITARMDGKDVRYEIDSDGHVLNTSSPGTARAGGFQGVETPYKTAGKGGGRGESDHQDG